MTTIRNRNGEIIDLRSQWVGDSLIRTVTRQFGKRNKIMIDVMEYAPQHTSKKRALKAARDAARRVGCVSVDCTSVADNEIVRQAKRLNGEQVITKIRSTTFAFDGIAE